MRDRILARASRLGTRVITAASVYPNGLASGAAAILRLAMQGRSDA